MSAAATRAEIMAAGARLAGAFALLLVIALAYCLAQLSDDKAQAEGERHAAPIASSEPAPVSAPAVP